MAIVTVIVTVTMNMEMMIMTVMIAPEKSNSLIVVKLNRYHSY